MDYLKKFKYNDENAINYFINNGYVIYEKFVMDVTIEKSIKFIIDSFDKLTKLSKENTIPYDVNGFAISILEKFCLMDEYKEIVCSDILVNIMKQFLGPDLALLGYDALWINVPKDTDPVLLKSPHTDSWTGTSINTIFSKFFFTNVDKYNGMGVSPGSHLQGLIPVKNRTIDPIHNIDFEIINLDNIQKGDILIWHPLLIHSTIGHSDKNIRVSMTSRYTSTETVMSSQERALGYRAISVGPMNHILRLIGNDHLSPFRTLGGYVGIDRRMADIYKNSNYKLNESYVKYI